MREREVGPAAFEPRRKAVAGSVAALAVIAALLVPPAAPVSAGHDATEYFDLAALPVPDYNGKQIFDGLKQFVGDHPYRVTGTPTEIRAALSLRDEMKGLGYDTQICSLPTNANVLCDPTSPGAGLKAVVATKRGTTRPDEWIMFIGHYDTLPTTIQGAYDNGAGTNAIRFLAREFADVTSNRSLVFAWYNSEEEGLLASARHAQYLKNTGQKITAVLGFDMTGISWPVATETTRSCLCMFHGPNDRGWADPLLRHVNYEFLKFPQHNNKVAVRGNNTRNSDEKSFADQGFPTLRWAGMKSANNYVAYHLPNDTIETIVAEAGGETYYEQGIENTLKSAYYTALAIDNHPPVPEATLTSSGLAVSVDASSSSDADGPISRFSWDFGDGSTGEGASAQHTYAAPGTYAVTLTVADNLWSEVTRTATFNVTVS